MPLPDPKPVSKKTYSWRRLRPKLQKWVSKNPHGLIEVLGPTGSGKSDQAVALAHWLWDNAQERAEIISVDSRQVYKEIDIASAKLTTQEQQGIPHHGFELVLPTQDYDAYQFQQYAFATIDEIHARGHRVILCGGTMLWLDSISENYKFGDFKTKDPAPQTPLWPTFKIGLDWERKQLYQRLDGRSEKQFDEGLIEETKTLMTKYPTQLAYNVWSSFGYQEISEYLAGKVSRTQALQANQKRNRNYAKRQLTWWRGRDEVYWIDAQKNGLISSKNSGNMSIFQKFREKFIGWI